MLKEFEKYLKVIKNYSTNTIESYLSDINIFGMFLRNKNLNFKEVNRISR